MLERDAPLPPRRLRGRSRQRLPVGGALARDGERAVARQPRAPVLEPRLHHLLDQQPAKPRAIDEQIARDFAPVGKRSEEHTSEHQSLMRISYAVFCLKKTTPTQSQ